MDKKCCIVQAMKPVYSFARLILVAGDIALLYAALWLALFIRYGAVSEAIWHDHLFPFTITFLLWLVIFRIAGLYDRKAPRNGYRFVTLLTKAMLSCVLAAVMVFYLVPSFGITPKTNLVLTAIIFSALFWVWRHGYNRFVSSRHLLHHIMFVGSNKETEEIMALFAAHPQLGYKTAGVCTPADAPRLKDVAREWRVDAVVYTKSGSPTEAEAMSRALYELIPLSISVYDLPKFYELVMKKVLVSVIGETWFLENLIAAGKSGYEAAKRLFDILVAVTLGTATLMLFPLVSLAVAFDSSGPVLYRQRRVGKNGRIFRVVKFRTMITNAEQAGIAWTTQEDNRVTRVGGILRKLRIDELPQLWNVLVGDMSLIGPRPERPEFVETLEKEIPHYPMRHLVKPGLTGWAQVNDPHGGASVKDSTEKLQYDLYYIKNRDAIVDLDILLRTARVVLSREGH
ncbi:MAG: sugar transferase [Patescibacteria group bacterium]